MYPLLMARISPWLLGPIVFAIWVAVLTILMRMSYRRLLRLSERTPTQVDDIVIRALRIPGVVIIFLTGGLILARILPLSPEWNKVLVLGVKVAVVLAGVVFFDRLVKGGLKYYSDKADYLKASAGIIQAAFRGLILLLALLIILETVGVKITPLIASLGVGSLAVALALQSPLVNFFAGLQIVADKPIQAGQYIKIGTGEEGYVTRIGWRSTTIRALSNNLVVIPNSKIMDAVITNYDLPDKKVSIVVEVGVDYGSDLDHVERVTLDVAGEVLRQVQGGTRDFEPTVRYQAFADSSIRVTITLRVEEFAKTYLIRHEFLKRLHRRYRQEGIVIPFPIRTLDLKREDLLLLKDRPTP